MSYNKNFIKSSSVDLPANSNILTVAFTLTPEMAHYIRTRANNVEHLMITNEKLCQVIEDIMKEGDPLSIDDDCFDW